MAARSILWSSRILTSSGAVADTALAWELVQGQGRESAPGLARAAHIRPRLKPERRHGPRASTGAVSDTDKLPPNAPTAHTDQHAHGRDSTRCGAWTFTVTPEHQSVGASVSAD